MLHNLRECDPKTLSLFHPKILEVIDSVRNINKQCLDVDAIYGVLKRPLHFNPKSSQIDFHYFHDFRLFSQIFMIVNCNSFLIFDKSCKNIR